MFDCQQTFMEYIGNILRKIVTPLKNARKSQNKLSGVLVSKLLSKMFFRQLRTTQRS